MPITDERNRKGVRGRLKRLRKYENDVLQFMDEKDVPFINN